MYQATPARLSYISEAGCGGRTDLCRALGEGNRHSSEYAAVHAQPTAVAGRRWGPRHGSIGGRRTEGTHPLFVRVPA
jgi:hypothetical protein